MSEQSDNQLIKEVKEKNNSEALQELINRHTGIYVEIINRYSFVPEFDRKELIEDKYYNIYKYIIDFKEEKKVKLSTYIGNRIKYECMNLICHKIEKEELNDNLICSDLPNSLELNKEFLDLFLKDAKNVEDKRFFQILEMRFLTEKPLTLKDIGNKLGISNERVRQIFENNIKKLKKHLKEELKEQKND